MSKDLAALRAEVETDQVSTKNAVEAHVASDEETNAARKELQLVAGKLALRAVALKAVASKLEEQQTALKAAGDASEKQLGRLKKQTLIAIRRAQAAAKAKPGNAADASIGGSAAVIAPTGTNSAETSSGASAGQAPIDPEVKPIVLHQKLVGASTDKAGVAHQGDLKLGSLVQVTTEDENARRHHGVCGKVSALLGQGKFFIAVYKNGKPTTEMLTVNGAWCRELEQVDGEESGSVARFPTPPGPWKKNVGWLLPKQKETLRELWLPVPLPDHAATLTTQLCEAEVAAGCAEIGWRLRVDGVVIVPPTLCSLVANHIARNWAAREVNGEGDALTEKLMELARRADLLVLPFQSENHWALLAIERRTAPKEATVKAKEVPASSAFVGCSKCGESGCIECDGDKATQYFKKIDEENNFFDPLGKLQEHEAPLPWRAVRYYDTLHSPSKTCADLAIALLDGLQRVGVEHHLDSSILADQRENSRIQKGMTCGFWVLHYVEEELRRWRGEGCFSFGPDLGQRLQLMNAFADRLR